MVGEFFTVIREFLSQGGDVLAVILGATILMWCLIVERYLYFRFEFPSYKSKVLELWQNRSDHQSWHAHRIREALISQTSAELSRYIPLVKTLVAISPLLGLLGTVTGMITVFDVMAITGTGNARMMASGISMATIPTMVGMVTALSGLYFGNRLEDKATKARDSLADQLTFLDEG